MPVMSKQGLPPLYYIGFKAFLFAKGLDYGLLSACWGGTGNKQDHMLGYCVPHSPKVTIDEKILLVLEVWYGYEFVFSVKNAHWNASRGSWAGLEQNAKGLLNSSALLFIHKANQTLIVFSNPAVIVMLCLPRIMLQCVQFVRWWQRHGLWSMQGYLFSFLYHLWFHLTLTSINF